jgi:hypothetical protein
VRVSRIEKSLFIVVVLESDGSCKASAPTTSTAPYPRPSVEREAHKNYTTNELPRRNRVERVGCAAPAGEKRDYVAQGAITA